MTTRILYHRWCISVNRERNILKISQSAKWQTREGADNGGRAFDAVLPEDASFEDAKVEMRGIGITALRASNGLVLIPYCDWAHRGKGEMQTWFKTAD